MSDIQTQSNGLAKAGPPKLSKEELADLARKTPKVAGLGKFASYLNQNMGSIRRIAAKHMSPERLYRIIISCVSRSPQLAECTMESLLSASTQAAELGLEPGSALGECALVAYNKNIGTREKPQWIKEAQFQPMYRGLISLAYRSGFVRSIKSTNVYQGDDWEYEEGLHPILKHKPKHDVPRDPKLITFSYLVVQLKDGGMVYDVMTRSEVDDVRKRSKSGNDGPWVTDFGEMAKKTVCRRGLKYTPMSVELSKALAADDAIESGDTSILAEFESMDMPEALPAPEQKSDKLTERIGKVPDDQQQKDVKEQETLV